MNPDNHRAIGAVLAALFRLHQYNEAPTSDTLKAAEDHLADAINTIHKIQDGATQ